MIPKGNSTFHMAQALGNGVLGFSRVFMKLKPNINLVLRSQKQKYATTGGKANVLIDDYIKNIKEWESKGGIGIHHTSVPKTIGELKKLGYK